MNIYNTPTIIAHRGFLNGPDQRIENRVSQLRNCLKRKYGIEFDVNLNSGHPESGKLVAAHDKTLWQPDNDFEDLVLKTSFSQPSFLDIKDLETVDKIVETLLKLKNFTKLHLFDFELLHRDIRDAWKQMEKLQSLGVPVAYRCSDRQFCWNTLMQKDSVKTIWIDELESNWFSERHAAQATSLGKILYYCSPDITPLQHIWVEGNDFSRLYLRLQNVADWGVQGICTDYGARILEHFSLLQK